MAKRKIFLNLEERVSVVHRITNGESASKIAKSLNVGKTQIQNIVKNKDDILSRWYAGSNSTIKVQKRSCTFDDLDSKSGNGLLRLGLAIYPSAGR